MQAEYRAPKSGYSWVPTRSAHAVGYTVDTALARRRRTRRGQRPLAGTDTLCVELGRPCLWPGAQRQVHTVNLRGTTVMHGCRELDRFRVPRKPAHNGCPEGPAEEGEGRALAKGNAAVHPRERTPGRGPSVTRARPRTAGPCGGLHVRPEAGARCGHAARRDLCVGYWVTGIPTVTIQTLSRDSQREPDFFDVC